MNAELLQRLLQPATVAELPQLVRAYALQPADLHLLKEHAEKFHYDDPAHAVEVAERAYQLGLLMPYPGPALGRWTLANALTHSGRYHDAARLFAEARNGYLAAGDQLSAARLGVGYVVAEAYNGRAEQALALVQEIEPILSKSAKTSAEDRNRLAGLLLNAGVCHELRGEYVEVLHVYSQLLELAAQLNDPLFVAQIRHNKALALLHLNEYDEALRDFTLAREGFRQQQARADLARLAVNQAFLLAKTGRYHRALAQLAEAEAQLANQGETMQRHVQTNVRAAIWLESKLPIDDSLIRALTTAAAAFAQHGPIYEAALARCYLGRCYASRQDWPAAQAELQAVRRLAAAGAGRFLDHLALQALGEIAQRQGDLHRAAAYLEEAVDQVEALRQPLYFDLLRASFLTDKLSVYQELTQIYVQLDRLAAAFAVADQAKARLLAEQIAFRLSDDVASLAQTVDPKVARLAQQLDTTLTNLEARYQQIRLARQFAENEPAAPEFTLAVQRIEQLEENAQTLIQSLQQARPAFAPLIGRRPDLLTTLQAQLGAALLLQFYCVRGEIHLFVADHTGIRIQSRLGLAQPVEAALTAFQGTIRRTLQLAQKKGLSACAQQLPTLLAATNRHLNTLYEHLLAPVMALLPANRPLIILPADNLAKVPFHALYNGSHYLLEERVVSSAPSATVLQLSLRPSSLRGQLLMAYNAGDLPAATAEVRTLQQLLPLATVVSDGQATPQFFLEHAPSQQLIHLASHAGFRPDNPMLSWLELAGRRLTLAEVARLHLDAELVVLSGCDTGQAQTRGADLLSLAAGFLGAGARSLLVSLWRVEDQVTTELMTQFYRALLAGQPRSTALQSAGLAILQRARRATDEQISYAHPAFWAPFHLIGCWQPINLTV